MTRSAPTFESRLARLDEIVRELEGETVELARALELFEEGVECLRGASDELARADAQVRALVERADGRFDLPELGGRGS
jgi:exodeoxyribonuclease VII small subunit